MRILEVLTYYRPHISGLTIYVERLSKALATQGHQVTVFTSQYNKILPKNEVRDGVIVKRVPVLFRVSKGVIMPSFGRLAWNMVRDADIVHLHLPQFDAPGIALRGRLYKKPVILTYHSDLQLPTGMFNRIVDGVVHSMNRIAGSLADAVVTYTHDFGSHSPYLSKYMGKKLHIIPPPVELEPSTENQVQEFHRRHKLQGKQIIGISARMAAEKGIEVLLKALPMVLMKYPNAFVLHASPDAIGEDAYAAKLKPLLEKYKSNYRLLGSLHGTKLSAFYRNLDCLVMCSLNNTETFGLVQIESMINGVPVVASNLPGVRQPVAMTGMGEIVEVGDHIALADAIIRALEKGKIYQAIPPILAESFDPKQTASQYIHLFSRLLEGQKDADAGEPEAYNKLRQTREKT